MPSHRRRLLIALFLLLASTHLTIGSEPGVDDDDFDDDFAEFDDEFIAAPASASKKSDERLKEQEESDDRESPSAAADPTITTAVDDDDEEENADGDADADGYVDDEFDDEEFESGPRQTQAGGGGRAGQSGETTKKAELHIADVPEILQRKWINYTSEYALLAMIVVYATVYFSGRVSNQRLSQAWLDCHRSILESQFAWIASTTASATAEPLDSNSDDGAASSDLRPNDELLSKEYEHVYSLWCTGRTGIEGLLVQMQLMRRQDLVTTLMRLFTRTSGDRLVYKVILDAPGLANSATSASTDASAANAAAASTGAAEGAVSDSAFVFAMVKRAQCAQYQKSMCDLGHYCAGERRGGERYGLPESFQVMCEIGEVPAALFDREICKQLAKFEDCIESIHISDQYLPSRQAEENYVSAGKTPLVQSVVIFTLLVPSKSSPLDSMKELVPLIHALFWLTDKVKRFRLSREGRAKVEKNRAAVQAQYLKMTHQQRSEAAQQRREDKRKAEKERIMNEEDPEKQRKWEEREYRRELKKRGPRIKQIKVKGM